MENKSFTTTVLVDQTPKEVFDAITNVRGWWSQEIKGNASNVGDEFDYHYQEVHRCKVRLIEVVPEQKITWHVLDNYFSFTNDDTEWKDTKVIFEISKQGNKTQLHFTHDGLVPAYECYNACVGGWTQYINQSLVSLIATGIGQPNASEKGYTPYEIAARFYELAKQEKWFEIQDELFADDVKSIEPANSPWFKYAEGKAAVKKKGEDWVNRIESANRLHTSAPIVGGNHFAVGRDVDIMVNGIGRVEIKQVMLYEVKDGKIISEQFFY